MSRTLKTTLKLSAAVLSLFLVAGCADVPQQTLSQSDLEGISSQAAQANETAQNAKAQAEAAMEAATNAQEMAQQAQGTAKSAQFTADQNSQKIDRMFKKSMYK
ncbi:MAG: hypothetical protein J5I81_14930 [Nitrococcus mobilis]|nr:hypothetical protein [Nitrococcus mobilis]